jgi:hypothetical protein
MSADVETGDLVGSVSGNGQPGWGSRGGAPAAAHLTGLSPTGMKARSQRCSDYGAKMPTASDV